MVTARNSHFFSLHMNNLIMLRCYSSFDLKLQGYFKFCYIIPTICIKLCDTCTLHTLALVSLGGLYLLDMIQD